MTSGHTVTISPAEAHVEVWIDGHKLADSQHALALEETGLPTRYYLPQEDVRMDLLTATNFHTTCPFKGEASYWSAQLDGQSYDGIVWSYPTPIKGAEAIAGYLSFYPDRTSIAVDGQPLAA